MESGKLTLKGKKYISKVERTHSTNTFLKVESTLSKVSFLQYFEESIYKIRGNGISLEIWGFLYSTQRDYFQVPRDTTLGFLLKCIFD